MRALLSQPWAWVMTVPPRPFRKEVENRRKPCPANMIGQTFAIHAALSWDEKALKMIASRGLSIPRAEVHRGAIVALATVDYQVQLPIELPVEQRPWFFGPYGYVFKDLQPLAKPVPCKGMLGFWKVPETVVAEVLFQAATYVEETPADLYYSQPCPECRVLAGRWCVGSDGAAAASVVHAGRVDLVAGRR